jgi:hypothetical protein
MQDSGEKTNPVGGEGREEMIHEREEREEGIGNQIQKTLMALMMSIMMSHPEDPHHTVLKELSPKILGETGMGHPLSRSP